MRFNSFLNLAAISSEESEGVIFFVFWKLLFIIPSGLKVKHFVGPGLLGKKGEIGGSIWRLENLRLSEKSGWR